MNDKLSQTNKSRATQDGGYGWVIVAICFLCTMIGDGLIFTYGAFYADLIDLYDDTASNVMIGGFLMLALSNGVGPFGAALISKYGFKKIMIIGSITSTIAISGSSFINSLFWFNVTMGFVGGITQGLVLLGAYTMPSLWFDKKRSIACAISFSGASFSCIIYPVVIEFLINMYSIRGCILIIGGLNLHFLVFSLLVKEPYTYEGKHNLEVNGLDVESKYEIDNHYTKNPFNKVTKAKSNVQLMKDVLKRLFPPELFKNISFWIITSSAFLITIILFAIPQSIKNYIDVIGFTRVQSEIFSITYGASALVAKLAVGITVRYIQHTKTVSIISGIILAIATSLVGVIRNYFYLLIYGAILGATGSNIVIMRYVIASKYIPRKYLTSAMGWIYLVQGTTLIIALFIADIGSVYGNYTLSFMVNGIIALLASVLLLILFFTKKIQIELLS